MSTLRRRKLAAALILSATVGLVLALILPSRAADEQKRWVSAQYAKHLNAAKDAEHKGDNAAALAELDKARALPRPTPYEIHVINELAAYADLKTDQFADAVKALEALVSDGFTDPAGVNRDINTLAWLNFLLKDYAKAIDYGNRAIQARAADDRTYLVVTQAYYSEGDSKNAANVADSWIQETIEKGETPKEQTLELILNSCVWMRDQACVTRIEGLLRLYYPQPKHAEPLPYIAMMN